MDSSIRVDITPKPGDALVNASACFPNVELLQRDFDILELLDFCAGLDAAVLHHRLHTVGSLPDSGTNPVARMLLREGVLQFHQAVAGDPIKGASSILESKRARSLLESMPTWISSDPIHPDIAMLASANVMLMDVVLEEQLELPLVLPARWAQLYLLLPDVREEQRASRQLRLSLAQQYDDLRDLLFGLFTSLNEDDLLPVPPIALEVLSRASQPADIPEALMEFRQKYESVRGLFATLDDVLRSSDVPLKRKFRERAKILKSIRTLTTDEERNAVTVLSSLGRNLNEATKVEKLADGVGLDDINWTKLIGYLVEQAETAYWKFRVRPLHGTKKRYLNMSGDEIASVVKKHFALADARRDTQRSRAYAERVDELLVQVGATGNEEV